MEASGKGSEPNEGYVFVAIVFPLPVEEKKVKKQKPDTEKDEEKQKDVPKLQINIFGKVNKDEGVEKLAWCNVDDQKQVRY